MATPNQLSPDEQVFLSPSLTSLYCASVSLLSMGEKAEFLYGEMSGKINGSGVAQGLKTAGGRHS